MHLIMMLEIKSFKQQMVLELNLLKLYQLFQIAIQLTTGYIYDQYLTISENNS